jgi:hypothetical protein
VQRFLKRTSGIGIVTKRYLNFYNIYSKQAGLQHVYNVLEPLVADAESKTTIDAFANSDFDGNVLTTNEVIALNLRAKDLVNADFRMNERIFNSTLCSKEALKGHNTKKIASSNDVHLPTNTQPKKG